MSDLIDLLESFNRKERFFLVKKALGTFALIDKFRQDLGGVINCPIPQDAFAAMDYHLDWLTAALYAHKYGKVDRTFENPEPRIIKGTQEDVDLLVAFRKGEQYHIVLVEAKGDTAWSNDQMDSKAARMERIFGPEGDCYPNVVPRFCLMSPRLPQQLKTETWPEWMTRNKNESKYPWLKLRFPPNRLKVTRCDADRNPAENGSHFCIEPA